MKTNLLLTTLLIAATTGLHAQTQSPAASAAASSSATSGATATMTEGEVRKIDKAAEKVTLRHAPIANLDMPAMTMVFKVADPTLLDAMKEGDKIRFSAERLNGAITVTAVEPVR